MIIRPYLARDAGSLSALMTRSIVEIGPRDYAQAQVAAWAARVPSADRLHEIFSDGRRALVAEGAGGRLLAFGDLEANGHLDYLYCAPDALGKGVASALYDALEAAARGAGVRRIYTEASEAARRLFTRKGFSTVGKREFEIGGVVIHNYAMEKLLPPSGESPGAEGFGR